MCLGMAPVIWPSDPFLAAPGRHGAVSGQQRRCSVGRRGRGRRAVGCICTPRGAAGTACHAKFGVVLVVGGRPLSRGHGDMGGRCGSVASCCATPAGQPWARPCGRFVCPPCPKPLPTPGARFSLVCQPCKGAPEQATGSISSAWRGLGPILKPPTDPSHDLPSSLSSSPVCCSCIPAAAHPSRPVAPVPRATLRAPSSCCLRPSVPARDFSLAPRAAVRVEPTSQLSAPSDTIRHDTPRPPRPRRSSAASDLHHEQPSKPARLPIVLRRSPPP